MRRLILWFATTVTILVLALSYRTSLTGSAASASTVAAAPATAGASDTAGASTTVTRSASSTDGSYTGKTVSTRYGPVQVKITVVNGTVSDATAVQYPSSNGKDRQINGYAIPKLNAAVIAAQSAAIHTVSGATYTSGGYITSLQSAIDQAKL